MKRNNFSKEEALKRLNSQNSNFKNIADYVIENNSNLEDLKQKVTELVFGILK